MGHRHLAGQLEPGRRVRVVLLDREFDGLEVLRMLVVGDQQVVRSPGFVGADELCDVAGGLVGLGKGAVFADPAVDGLGVDAGVFLDFAERASLTDEREDLGAFVLGELNPVWHQWS